MLLLKKTKTDQPVTLLVLLQSCGLKTLPSPFSKTHSTFSLTPTHSRQSAAMAAAKAISQTTSCLLSKTPFALKHKSHITNLCFGTKRVAFPSKRLFSCRAIYNPQVQITEEGQPETLDYRVFFVNNSGKKVLFFYLAKKFLFCVFGLQENVGKENYSMGKLGIQQVLELGYSWNEQLWLEMFLLYHVWLLGKCWE